MYFCPVYPAPRLWSYLSKLLCFFFFFLAVLFYPVLVFSQDLAGMLLVALIRLIFINMSFDGIKIGLYYTSTNPLMWVGWLFSCRKKLICGILQGLKLPLDQWRRQSPLSFRSSAATWTSGEDNPHLDKGIETALRLPTPAFPLKVPSAINEIQMKSTFKLRNVF